MEDGVIVAVGQARSRTRAYQMMVDRVEAAVGAMGKIRVAYVHAAALEEIEKLKAMIEQRMVCVESLITELSPALGSTPDLVQPAVLLSRLNRSPLTSKNRAGDLYPLVFYFTK